MASMAKSDIDALVMHLLDTCVSYEQGCAIGSLSNQQASELLRVPLTKIKRLRYEAGLKYDKNPEQEGRRRFALALEKAGLEFDNVGENVTKIVFVVEDVLAKNWIQGQIKAQSGTFDNSFNTEIIKVEPDAFFATLKNIGFGVQDVNNFKSKYDDLMKKKTKDARREGFKNLVSSFVNGAVGGLGGLVVNTLTPLP